MQLLARGPVLELVDELISFHVISIPSPCESDGLVRLPMFEALDGTKTLNPIQSDRDIQRLARQEEIWSIGLSKKLACPSVDWKRERLMARLRAT